MRRSKIKSESGAACVEGIIGAIVFFCTAFMGIELMIFAYKAAALQYIVTQASNRLSVGYCSAVTNSTNCNTFSQLSSPYVTQLTIGSACPGGYTPKCKRAIAAWQYAQLRGASLGLDLRNMRGCVLPLNDVDTTNVACSYETSSPNLDGIQDQQIGAFYAVYETGFFGGRFHLSNFKISGFSMRRVERQL